MFGHHEGRTPTHGYEAMREAGPPRARGHCYLIYAHIMLARPRTLPTGFIAPCLPAKAHTLPSGGLCCMRLSTMATASWRVGTRPAYD
jgi:hypothetical protein